MVTSLIPKIPNKLYMDGKLFTSEKVLLLFHYLFYHKKQSTTTTISKTNTTNQ